MLEIKTKNELDKLISSNSHVFIKVGMESCGPCRLLEESMEKVQNAFPDFIFAKVDADECDDELISMWKIRNVPVSFVYTNGELDYSKVGGMNEVGIKEFLTIKK